MDTLINFRISKRIPHTIPRTIKMKPFDIKLKIYINFPVEFYTNPSKR